MKYVLASAALASTLAACASVSVPKLHEAVLANDLSEARCLIADGERVDVKDQIDRTALHRAASDGSPEMVRFLIHEGAGIDLRDRTGATPLYLACVSGEEEAACTLIEAGADVTTASGLGGTPLMAACSRRLGAVAERLIARGAPLVARDFRGRTALACASASGGTEVVRLLLQHGAEVDAAASDGDTPLGEAAMNGHLETAELLVAHGADINATNLQGSTPLLFAAQSMQTEMVLWLRAQGAEVGAVRQVFPLMHSAESLEMILDCAEAGRRESRAQELLAAGNREAAVGELDQARAWYEARIEECDAERMASSSKSDAAKTKRAGSILGLLTLPVGTEGAMMTAHSRANAEIRTQAQRITSLELSLGVLRARAERCRTAAKGQGR